MAILLRRQNCYQDGFAVQCSNSAWENWVRWLVLGLIVLGALFLFFGVSFLSARRRRRMGYAPYRGTGWAVGRNYYPNQSMPPPPESYGQNPNYNGWHQPYYAPPAYSSNNNGGAAGQYYGQGQNVELTQPENVYGGTANKWSGR